MADFAEIDWARRALGLGETASMPDIRKAYRRLANRYHPDKGGSASDSERMAELNRAYRVLLNYCRDYRYSFHEEDVARTYPNEEYMRTWADRWYHSI